MTPRLPTNGTNQPFTKVRAAESSQNDAGAANGKRRRRTSGNTSSSTAGTENHSGVDGAAGELRLTTSSSIAATAITAISSSNQYSRARSLLRVMR
jgi:hypothetical protein